MACPYCKATTTKQRKKLTKLGYKTYYCKACQRKYNERTGSPFIFANSQPTSYSS